MIEFVLKKVNENSDHYNLTFIKEVHKRTGDVVKEPKDTIYTLPLNMVKNCLAHENTFLKFGDKDVSLKEYLPEFYKSYNEVCELLKKTL